MGGCKACGGEVITDGFRLCKDCGIIQDSKSEVENSSLSDYITGAIASSESYVRHHQYRSSQGFKVFKNIFLGMTYSLNSSFSMTEKIEQMLPQLYQACLNFHTPRKRSLIAALLYFMYREEGSMFTVNHFKQKIGIELPFFNKSLQDVQQLFKFSSVPKSELFRVSITDRITKLAEIILKPGVADCVKTADIVDLAHRLALIVQSKEWFNKFSLLSYIDQVSTSSTILAAHYCLVCATSRKGYHGKRLCFRYSTLNVKKAAEFTDVSERTVFAWVKTVQSILYLEYKSMPIKPGNVKKCIDIGRVLVEVLDFMDLNIADFKTENEETDEESNQFFIKRSFLTHSLSSFLSKHGTSSPFPWTDFLEHLREQKETIEHLRNSVFSLKRFKGNNEKGYLSIDNHIFNIQHIQLTIDLLLGGCSVKEFDTNKYSELTRKYIESKTNEDDKELGNDFDDELDDYIKRPEEINTNGCQNKLEI